MDRQATEGDRLGLFLISLIIGIRVRDDMLKTSLDGDVESYLVGLFGCYKETGGGEESLITQNLFLFKYLCICERTGILL